MNETGFADRILQIARNLALEVDNLTFADPVTHVYNPLVYAWKPFEKYIRTYGNTHKRVVFAGMNPGPWGMSQTGIPFGEVDAVKNWLGIDEPVGKPKNEHPSRRIDGFSCDKSEVSGRRLWGMFKEAHEHPATFFKNYMVLNYCPLVFMESSGRNRTPDKLPAGESSPLFEACDKAMSDMLAFYQPEWAIGVGGFAHKRLQKICRGKSIHVGTILHPSPASPKANANWSAQAKKQLADLGVTIGQG